MAPIFIFCYLLFFLNFELNFLNYLIGVSINLDKFFVLISRACSEQYIYVIGELGGGGWHSNRTSAHCYKCLDFTSEDPKS